MGRCRGFWMGLMYPFFKCFWMNSVRAVCSFWVRVLPYWQFHTFPLISRQLFVLSPGRPHRQYTSIPWPATSALELTWWGTSRCWQLWALQGVDHNWSTPWPSQCMVVPQQTRGTLRLSFEVPVPSEKNSSLFIDLLFRLQGLWRIQSAHFYLTSHPHCKPLRGLIVIWMGFITIWCILCWWSSQWPLSPVRWRL